MKKLTKIKLVNWHLFANQTIEIQDNTLISGENGSGKSTLLDAIQYLLVGGRGGVKFNVAANEDARRTLEGYVRGRIGSEEKEFIRPNDVITHVALEFYDEDDDTFNILGVILDLPKNATLKERFYILNNLSIDDALFLENNYPRDYRSMKAFLKELGQDLRPFDTQKEYRDALAKFFGMDSRKYSQILPKALAFRPIDLQAFIYEFLLDDDPIDIRSLKNNVEQLKRVETQIIKDREKLEKLDAITSVGEEIIQSKNQLVINQIIEQLNWIEQRERFIKTSEEELTKSAKKLEGLREEKSKIDIQIESVEAQITRLERIKGDDDIERTLGTYQENLRKVQIEYETQKETILELSKILKDEFDLLKELLNKINSNSFKEYVSYYQKNQDNLNPLELQNLLSNVSSEKEAYREAYLLERKKHEDQKIEISNKIFMIQQRISQLKKNVKTYPYGVQKLISVLNERLSEHYQKEIKVYPLAELIEVNDEKWRNALEGQLGNQKFNIIVEPEYFDLALRVYNEIQEEQQIYGVGLVNTQKLSEFYDVNPNSLAAKVDTDYRLARYYVNMLLNNVITVNSVDELKNHSRSITASCMTYSNYTARQLNPNTYKVPFIGNNSTDMQIAIEIEDLEKLEKEMDRLQQSTNEYTRIIRLLSELKSSQIIHQNQLRLYDRIKETRREFAQLEEQVRELSNNPSVAKLERQLDEERKKRTQLRLDSDSLVGKIATTRDDMQRINDSIEETKARLVEYNNNQDKFAKEHPDKLSLAHTQFYALKQRYKNHNQIIDELAKDTVSLNSAVIRKETEISNLMRAYNREYFFGSEPNFNALDEYIKEANVIRNNNLVKYEREATELRKNSEIGFREEFVNKLRASIETAQHQIEELNVALEGKRFGNDSYKLIYGPSLDPDFKVYYEMIIGAKAFEEHTLFTEGLTKKNEQILMELYDKITSNNPEYDKLSFQYLDYRNYMSYDIEVTHSNGTKSMFSKVSKEKSGGETQVPFYIVIAASFQQLLSRNKRINSGCIVLFDEAFNNMDDTRIDAMMKYYSSLSIQLLIAIPPQRVVNIINYVNTSLVVVKHDDYAIVESFKDNRILGLS